MFIETVRQITAEAIEKKERAKLFWKDDGLPKDDTWISQRSSAIIRSVYESIIKEAENGNNAFVFVIPIPMNTETPPIHIDKVKDNVVKDLTEMQFNPFCRYLRNIYQIGVNW